MLNDAILHDDAMAARVGDAAAEARRRLLRLMTASGHWDGELAPSALATAVATFALAQAGPSTYRDLILRGLTWLARNANADGGWGDTPRSASNVSTTLLCWSAFNCAAQTGLSFDLVVAAAERWLCATIGSLEPKNIARYLVRHYGRDRSFSVPILTMLALAGRLGPAKQAWHLVPQLPFELAMLPHKFYRMLRLDVVSYALPALIAIGYVRHKHTHGQRPFGRMIRTMVSPRALTLLQDIQPSSGGYLEATPLTAFVVMSLVGSGLRNHPVTDRGVRFLRSAARPDGSWPIDSNLATWLTTLAVDALHQGVGAADILSVEDEAAMRDWLLDQQFAQEHPYTHAAPGGWAWTNLPGGVPDADDTAGALLALTHLGRDCERAKTATIAGIGWLLDLQNRDGGMPTFCRGWGRLPFDRSCPDITAHALRAFNACQHDIDEPLRERIQRSTSLALRYLKASQRTDGAWFPLWFGNEHARHHRNPTYGTAQVVRALIPLGDPAAALVRQGIAWLRSAQNSDGGWGGDSGAPSTIEETSLAVSALATAGIDFRAEVACGAAWLAAQVAANDVLPAAPIGLYFASLWYYEKLYPYIFATGALARAHRLLVEG